MPDQQDYADLERLLKDPRPWTKEEAAAMQSLLKTQRDAAAAVHPKDRRRQAEMYRLVQQIEEAIRKATGKWRE